MPGMWSDAAKQAAEQEFGRRNYRQLAFARSLPRLLVLAAVAGVVWLAVKGGQAGVAATREQDAGSFGWGWAVLGGAVVLAGVVLLLVRRARRPYRVPRRWFRRY